MEGKVISVNLSEKRGTVKHPMAKGVLVAGNGLEGDAHAGPWHRQVSLLAQESIDKMKEYGLDELGPGIFAENITTQGLVLNTLPVGERLQIGQCVLRVTQIGKECTGPCEVARKVGKCVMPTEGIFAEVLAGGEIAPGMSIRTMGTYRIAIVTASDRCAAGERQDLSGPAVEEACREFGEVTAYQVLPDDRAAIAGELRRLCDGDLADVVFTTGGTGFSPRDVTPEATLDAAERLAPGIPEAMRAYSAAKTNRAMLSRAAAGIRGRTLIVNLPGSPKAVKECLEAILPALGHGLDILRQREGDCGAVQ